MFDFHMVKLEAENVWNRDLIWRSISVALLCQWETQNGLKPGFGHYSDILIHFLALGRV